MPAPQGGGGAGEGRKGETMQKLYEADFTIKVGHVVDRKRWGCLAIWFKVATQAPFIPMRDSVVGNGDTFIAKIASVGYDLKTGRLRIGLSHADDHSADRAISYTKRLFEAGFRPYKITINESATPEARASAREFLKQVEMITGPVPAMEDRKV